MVLLQLPTVSPYLLFVEWRGKKLGWPTCCIQGTLFTFSTYFGEAVYVPLFMSWWGVLERSCVFFL
jgi:hypothetical protein